jgi:hypothetical protein
VPVLVITDDPAVARACAPIYAAVPYLADSLPTERWDLEAEVLLERGVIAAVQAGLCSPGHEVVVLQVGWPHVANDLGSPGVCAWHVGGGGWHRGTPREAPRRQGRKAIALEAGLSTWAPAVQQLKPHSPTQGVSTCGCRCVPVVSVKVAPGRAEQYVSHEGSAWYEPTLSLRSTAIALEVGGGWGGQEG